MSEMHDFAQFEQVTLIDKGVWVADRSFYYPLIDAESKKILASGDKYSENYSMKRLELDKHQAFDLLILKATGELVGWCGLFNGNRYPEGVYRIMNRLYLNPHYRSHYFKPYTRTLYFDQIKRNRDVIKLLFLSRNGLKARFHLKHWVKYGCGEKDWKISQNLIKVANAENQMCYQYIAYKKYADIDWPPQGIDALEWLKLPAEE